MVRQGKRKVSRKAVWGMMVLLCGAGMGAAAAETDVPTQTLDTVYVWGNILRTPQTYAGGQVARSTQLGVLGERDFMDTPFTTISYTAQRMENTMKTTVAEVLQSDPGVRYQYPSGTLMENYYIRGLTYNGGNMSLNGVTGMAPYGSAATEFLENVELQKGPTALLSGINPGGEVAGAINLTMKRAQQEPIRKISLDYAAPGRKGVHADISSRLGAQDEFGARVNAVRRDGRFGVDGQTQGRKLASLALDYVGERWGVTVDGYYIKDDFSGAGGYLVQSVHKDFLSAHRLPAAPDPGKGIKGLYGALENKAVMMRAEYYARPDLYAYFGVGKAKNEYTGFVGGAIVINPDKNGDAQVQVTNGRVGLDKWSYDGGVHWKTETGTWKHDVVLGFSVLDLKNDNAVNSASFTDNLYHFAFSGENLPLTPSASEQVRIQRYKMSSWVLADAISSQDDKWSVIVGMRHQTVDQKRFHPRSGQLMQTYKKSKQTPMVSVLVKLWGPQVALYASYIEGLRPGPVVPFGRGLKNEGYVFAPYATKQYEVGVKWDAGTLANTLSVYQIEQPNQYMTQDKEMTLDGKQRYRGAEWNVFGEIKPGLRLLGGVAYANATVAKAMGATEGKSVVANPRWQASLGVEWDVPSCPDLTLTTQWRFAGEQYVDPMNQIVLPSSTRWDIGARYQMKWDGHPVTWRMAVENVLNSSEWGGLRAGYVVYPGTERTVKLSATVSF